MFAGIEAAVGKGNENVGEIEMLIFIFICVKYYEGEFNGNGSQNV